MKRPAVLVIAIAVVLVAIVLWWRFGPGSAPEPPPPPPPAPAVAPEPVEEPEPPLPALDDSDALVRDLAESLGIPSELVQLREQDLLRLLVRVVDTVAEGNSPRKLLHALAPRDDYLVIEHGGKFYPDPVSYRRYDAIAQAIGGLDVDAVVQAYQRVEPLADEAFVEIGGTAGGFRARLETALDLLLQTPVPDVPPELVDVAVDRFEYVDPKLEQLMPAQKHLLRLGPDNQRQVLAFLRAFRAGLGG